MKIPRTAEAHRLFVLENTKLSSPSLLPEIKLHLAHQSLGLWQKTIDDLDEIGLEPPYWAFAWAGGQALARYVIDHPYTVAGKQVVDLGSGSGIVAVAAAKCGAARVQAFEVDPLALAAISLNGAVNGVTIENSSVDILAGETRVEADVLLLGDLFYEAGMAGHVLGLAERSQAAGAIVVAGDPGRSYFPYERFQILASYDVPVSRELEDADVKKTRVWQFS